jgi:hypothetical protein
VPEPGLTVTLGWAKDAVSCANAPEQVAIITRAASVFFMFRGRGGACRGGGYKLGISAAAARGQSRISVALMIVTSPLWFWGHFLSAIGANTNQLQI